MPCVFIRYAVFAPSSALPKSNIDSSIKYLENAEAVSKPRESQHCDEACNGHEADSLSLDLGQGTAASRALEFCEEISLRCNPSHQLETDRLMECKAAAYTCQT